jgi:hypothetical protein
MANYDGINGFRPVTCIGGLTGVMPTWQGKMRSNNIAALGDLLYASAGYVRTVVTTDKAVVGVMAQTGLQKGGTTGSTTTPADVLFWPAHDSIIFAAQTSGVMSQTYIYKLVDHEGTAGNSTGISNQEINEDATTNKNVYILGWKDPGRKAPGSSNGTWGRALVIFAKSKFQARGAMVLSTQYIGH